VREVVFPAVTGGEQTLRELVHEYKTKGPFSDAQGHVPLPFDVADDVVGVFPKPQALLPGRTIRTTRVGSSGRRSTPPSPCPWRPCGRAGRPGRRPASGAWSFAITSDSSTPRPACRVYDADAEHNRVRREMFDPVCGEIAGSSSRPDRPASSPRRAGVDQGVLPLDASGDGVSADDDPMTNSPGAVSAAALDAC
jgi:hypothetical protein